MTEKNYMLRLSLSDEERIWVNVLALKVRRTITTLIMDLLDRKSKELGVKLPKDRVSRRPFKGDISEHEKLIKSLQEELRNNVG